MRKSISLKLFFYKVDIRGFTLILFGSMTFPLWYHVMLAAGLDPYETQSKVIGSPERNGCSAPTIVTLNGFTVKHFETKLYKIFFPNKRKKKKTKFIDLNLAFCNERNTVFVKRKSSCFLAYLQTKKKKYVFFPSPLAFREIYV